jgi:galactokinase/mevalonate kinase-like predicted kinase
MKYKSNGKLMLTAEYLALDNALVLTLPTKFGQSLILEEKKGNGLLNWKSFTNESKVWFEATLKFNNNTFEIIESSNQKVSTTLTKVLNKALKLSTHQLNGELNYEVNTYLDFPEFWGLGSSSTLLNNIAQWFNVDPFELHFNVFNGSGYDIAAAYSNKPITYQVNNKKPLVKTVAFTPSFKEHIYFIYLNKKQNSYNEVKKYQENKNQVEIEEAIRLINSITNELIATEELSQFEDLLNQHELILSSVLGIPTIKEQLFSDYKNGIVKSLGAWGGDFVLVTIKDKEDLNYFKKKGYHTTLSYNEMII